MPKKVSLRRTNKVVPVVLPDPQDEKRARRREEKRVCHRSVLPWKLTLSPWRDRPISNVDPGTAPS